MTDAHILVVDDEKLIRWALKDRLEKERMKVTEAADGAQAERALATGTVDLVLLDLKLPDTDGIKLIKKIQAASEKTPAIIMTAFSSVDSAIEAMKEGAYDYLTKPFNMDEMMITLRRALENSALKREHDDLMNERKRKFGAGTLIGSSAKMTEIKGLIQKIARSEATTVLLRGESGSGKDVVARAIHYESARAARPFMNITCTALQDTLLESELFGHERGSFTDAKTQKKGLFELAEGGTVFMDEIGDMSPNLQAKLLRALEAKSFKRIGGTEDIQVDVRVIAATNRDLERAVQEGKFREDLYYRLNVIPIVIGPLRERRDDIALLVEHFLTHFSKEFRKPGLSISKAALEKMEEYRWPGNVRELRNVLERAILLGDEPAIRPEDLLLGRTVPTAEAGRAAFHLPDGGIVLENVERELVKQALDRTRGNQTRAAELLGISRDQIRYRMEKFGMLSASS